MTTSTTTRCTSTKRSSGRRLRRLITSVASLATAAALLGTSVQDAEAWTLSRGTGSVGTAGILTPIEGYSSYHGANVIVPWMFSLESPGYKNSWQYVCATYRLWRQGPGFNQVPSWNHISSHERCSWIEPAKAEAVIGGANFPVTPFATYGVDVVVTWRLSSGVVVGTRLVDFVHWEDFVCKTPAPGCQRSAPGSLTLN
jgi:hypothetical protein